MVPRNNTRRQMWRTTTICAAVLFPRCHLNMRMVIGEVAVCQASVAVLQAFL